ncbi:hypothetical protein EVAR_38940_1 [Eumeta japonica]|uniref:Uncharacterized protein n=1 Tax=Eumeta variegata TaxID=151549 RepID=A0A4C1W9Z4_EUMVA|nr:hypothetical protein EVAR_38940_1 [Eumeta japonica]
MRTSLTPPRMHTYTATERIISEILIRVEGFSRPLKLPMEQSGANSIPEQTDTLIRSYLDIGTLTTMRKSAMNSRINELSAICQLTIENIKKLDCQAQTFTERLNCGVPSELKTRYLECMRELDDYIYIITEFNFTFQSILGKLVLGFTAAQNFLARIANSLVSIIEIIYMSCFRSSAVDDGFGFVVSGMLRGSAAGRASSPKDDPDFTLLLKGVGDGFRPSGVGVGEGVTSALSLFLLVFFVAADATALSSFSTTPQCKTTEG